MQCWGPIALKPFLAQIGLELEIRGLYVSSTCAEWLGDSIHSSCRTQQCVSLSSTESEWYAASSGTCDGRLYLHHIVSFVPVWWGHQPFSSACRQQRSSNVVSAIGSKTFEAHQGTPVVQSGFWRFAHKAGEDVPEDSRPQHKTVEQRSVFLLALHVWLFCTWWKGLRDWVWKGEGKRAFETASVDCEWGCDGKRARSPNFEVCTNLPSRSCVCWHHAGLCLLQKGKAMLMKQYTMGTPLQEAPWKPCVMGYGSWAQFHLRFAFQCAFCLECLSFSWHLVGVNLSRKMEKALKESQQLNRWLQGMIWTIAPWEMSMHTLFQSRCSELKECWCGCITDAKEECIATEWFS